MLLTLRCCAALVEIHEASFFLSAQRISAQRRVCVVKATIEIPGGPKKRPELSYGIMQHSRWNESAENHACNEQTSSNMSMNFHIKHFHISRDTSEIVLHVIKQCLQAFYHHRNRFSKLMVSAGVVEWKNRFFSSTLKRLNSTRRLTLTFWRRPCCRNAAVCVQTMISSSCKTALHHTAPKQL